jgi:hypothetical protein
MELPASGYFYALATLAMTFAGFSAIVVALRQGTGQPLSPLHVLFTRFFIEAGLLTAFFAMLAPTLALSAIPQAKVWQISSAIILVILVPYLATYPRRRRASAPDGKMPPQAYVTMTPILVGIGALGANMIGWPNVPGPLPLAIAIIILLATTATVFVGSYSSFLRD